MAYRSRGPYRSPPYHLGDLDGGGVQEAMSAPNSTGRVDLLLVRFAEWAAKQYLEPRLGVSVWNPQTEALVTKAVQRFVSQEPVQLVIPCEVARLLDGIGHLRASGMIQEGPRARA